MSVIIDGTAGITTPAETVQGALTTTGNTILGDATTDTLTVGVTGIVKDASGNVGIGTSINNVYDGVAQPRPLVVQSASTATGQYDSTNALVICNSDTTNNNASQLNFAAITGASTNQYTSAVISCIYGARTNTIYPSGILTFATSTATQSPLERMRIDSSGNLLVGTTTVSVGEKMKVVGGNNVVVVRCNNSSSTIVTSNASGTALYTAVQFCNNGDTYTSTGNITVSGSTTAYNTSSDYRLKNTIAPMTGALEKVAALKPCTYKWNVDGSDGQGFIAHELDAVVPGCVTGEKDAVENYIDEEGNEQTRIKPQGIDTSFLVATLTAAIQEQQALIIQLQADVATLKALSA